MKTLMLSTALAAAMGVASLAPASAAMISRADVAVAPATTNVDCRTVERTKIRNGVRKTVVTRECDEDRYERRVYRDRGDRYVERRYERRDRDYDRPGITVRLPN